MTWKQRLALPECARPGCSQLKQDGSAYCVHDAADQRRRNRQHMQFKRHQLALPFVHISNSG